MWNGRTGPEVGVCLRCPKFTRKFENMFRGDDRSRDMGGPGDHPSTGATCHRFSKFSMGNFLADFFLMYDIQHYFIYRPQSEDFGISCDYGIGCQTL